MVCAAGYGGAGRTIGARACPLAFRSVRGADTGGASHGPPVGKLLAKRTGDAQRRPGKGSDGVHRLRDRPRALPPRSHGSRTRILAAAGTTNAGLGATSASAGQAGSVIS